MLPQRSTHKDTVLAALPAAAVSGLVRSGHQSAVLRLALSVIQNLSSYVRSIDFALEWTMVESGRALFRQGGSADSVYVVLSGRLRSVISHHGSGKRELVAEYGRGELTGIVETLMRTPRSTTVLAVRDTEVAKLPAGLIDFIKLRFPKVLMILIRLLGEKLQKSWERPPDLRPSLSAPVNPPAAGQQQQQQQQQQLMTSDLSNLSTVAIFPLSVPSAAAFTLELLHALGRVCDEGEPATRVTREGVLRQLGKDAFSQSEDYRLSAWLAQQEDKHRMVLYQCERELSPWTRLCVRHADVILILVDPVEEAAAGG